MFGEIDGSSEELSRLKRRFYEPIPIKIKVKIQNSSVLSHCKNRRPYVAHMGEVFTVTEG